MLNEGTCHARALGETDDALFDRIIAINLQGTFNFLRIAAKRLRSGGRIVNFSSSVVGLALPGYSVYAATKSAVETITNIFAKELRGREITVHSIAPGPTATALFLDGKTPANRASRQKNGSARTPGPAGRYRGHLLIPRQSRQRLGQWTNPKCERRNRLTKTAG